ncbi:MAG: repeat-containing protein, partial [Pedosphaera sp.]|nr:repeat-containing protein [Pedosphaera sp.]
MKTKWFRIVLVVLLLAVAGGLAWQASRQREPMYQGKPLSYWLGGYDSPPLTNVTPSQADAAVRQLGTNAFPVLFRRLQQRDSEFRITIMRLLQKQHVISIPVAPPDQNYAAVQGFDALGPQASNAVLRLIEVFDSDPHPFPQQAVPVILRRIGPSARQAIPALLRGMTHTNATVRNNAICAIHQIRAEPKVVVPALMKCLNDPDIFVRAQAARALGAMGQDAQPAVPGLLELWRREPPSPTSDGTTMAIRTMVS